jgi:hypothetical protein
MSFLHSGDLGDIIHSLVAVRALGGGVYYLCTRGWTKEMTPARFEAISALMRVQPYIKGVEWHKGQKVKWDFTDFRKHYSRGPGRNLATMHAMSLNTGLTIDTRTPWLQVPDFEAHGRPVIARSARYHCVDDLDKCKAEHRAPLDRWEKIWPEVLESYPDPIFIGLPEEHLAFEKAFGKKVEYRRTHDFLQIAKLIKGSSIFIGNQSSPMCVAEGLKHPSIQETHFKVNDVVFERANGHYVRSYRDWKAIQQQKVFAIMLQFYSGDFEQAKALCELIVDIETEERKDIEFVVAGRFDVPSTQLDELRAILLRKFSRVFAIRSPRRGEGWPDGCNALWSGAVSEFCYMRSQGHSKAEAVFTMEPDCLPLRRDWINQLRAAWNDAHGKEKVVTGHLCKNEAGEPTHINGNLIISTYAGKLAPKILQGADSKRPWDCVHGSMLLKIGQDTPAIYQNKRRDEFSLHDWQDVNKLGVRPAIWHGIRTMDGLKIAREALVKPAVIAKDAPAQMALGI